MTLGTNATKHDKWMLKLNLLSSCNSTFIVCQIFFPSSRLTIIVVLLLRLQGYMEMLMIWTHLLYLNAYSLCLQMWISIPSLSCQLLFFITCMNDLLTVHEYSISSQSCPLRTYYWPSQHILFSDLWALAFLTNSKTHPYHIDQLTHLSEMSPFLVFFF